MVGKHKRKVGRPKKFRLSDIVQHKETGAIAVVVKHRMRGTKSEYCVIPLTGGKRRFGPSSWRGAETLDATGLRSSTGSLVTYRANEWLDEQLPEGRGCLCHCCVHEAQPRKAFSTRTGVMRAEDYDY